MAHDNPFLHDTRFDGLYLNVAQTCAGIDPLLHTLFSFLRRQTDFFEGGGGTQAALDKVMDVAKQHAILYEESKMKNKKKQTKPVSKPVAKEAEPAAEPVVEMDLDGGFDISAATPSPPKPAAKADNVSPTKQPAAAASTSTTPSLKQVAAVPLPDAQKAAPSSTPAATKTEEDEDASGPPPVGNGGTVEGKYVWTQTLEEVSVTVPLQPNTRGRDLQVTIAKQHLTVGYRNTPKDSFLVNAPLQRSIVVDDSFWTVEDGNRLCLNLQKVNRMEWWPAVCQGDPEINVRHIQPENSSLQDLDGETRQTVEKMMHDNRQKALGLPTSEEEQKLNMLEKFKQQHPELDFTNAKIG